MLATDPLRQQVDDFQHVPCQQPQSVFRGRGEPVAELVGVEQLHEIVEYLLIEGREEFRLREDAVDVEWAVRHLRQVAVGDLVETVFRGGEQLGFDEFDVVRGVRVALADDDRAAVADVQFLQAFVVVLGFDFDAFDVETDDATEWGVCGGGVGGVERVAIVQVDVDGFGTDDAEYVVGEVEQEDLNGWGGGRLSVAMAHDGVAITGFTVVQTRDRHTGDYNTIAFMDILV